MEIANQVMYLGFGLIFFGLAFSSFHDLIGQFTTQSSRHYWAFSLLAMTFSCVLFLVFPYFGPGVLTLANLMQITSDAALIFLFRSFNVKINKWLLIFFIFLLVAIGGFAELIRARETYSFRVDFLSAIAILLSIWQIYELAQHYIRSKSIYSGFLIFAIAAQIALWIYRIWVVDHYLSFFGHDSIYDEGVPEFLARLIVIVLYALIFIAIGNYFFSELVRLERTRSQEMEDQMLSTLKALALARDNETGNHVVRTQYYVKALAERLHFMGYYSDQLDPEKIKAMFRAAPLHDIGKVGIPDHILLKPGPLDSQEWETMKTHAAIGESVLKASASKLISRDQLIQCAINIAGAHHERWDGSGYPRGLKEDSIPIEARIMSLADAYDALVTKRHYKRAWSHQDAMREIISKKEIYFDPFVVEAFIIEENNFISIAKKYAD